ncbi:MAG: hypothetical protein WBL20_16210 [Sphingobium sp.]
MSIGKIIVSVAKFALHRVIVPVLEEKAIDEAAKAVARKRRREGDGA